MSELGPETLAGGEKSPPSKPKRRPQSMVNVYNSHRFRKFFLRGGEFIPPGGQKRIPTALFEKVKDQCPWLKRAEKGDVI